MHVETTPFGTLRDGREVDRIELAAGTVTVGIITYGGTLATFRGPDDRGDVADIALGFDTLEGWLTDPQYFGGIVGRFANRIRHGRFPLDGIDIRVTTNRGAHHLHGGAAGFDKAVWAAEPFATPDTVGVTLTHRSPAGDEGFPGALDVAAVYELDAGGALQLTLEASTDAPTVVNLTNHVYLNLAGEGTILDHEVALAAGSYLPVDADTLPLGEVRAVAGTPMDFRTPQSVGSRIGHDDEQLRLAGGYDHCYALDGTHGELRPCATVVAAGRRLDVATTQPGVQFYSGQGIRLRAGRGGREYGPHSGLCLETQHYPDSPNHPAFPSTVLRPGERFGETTVYRLGSA